VFFDASALVKQGLKGLPDGLKVDQQGNVWLGGPGGILVISPEGKHLGTILTGEATANCAWGDDGSTLYFTADMYLCRIKTLAKGKIPG
jgi:gluconolactonase